MLRRISALAAWLLLLHVTVFAANRACVHQAGAPTQQTDHHEHHPAPADQHQPCSSLIACAMALESGATNDAAPAQPLRALLIALAAAAPASTVRAPEPP